MAFRQLEQSGDSVQLLQRSLERGRLAHGYLFSGDSLEALEDVARTLAKTLNCLEPVRRGTVAVDCCDHCLSCRKVDHGNHADVHWVRPESKTRIVTVDQMREVMREIQLKPKESQFKVVVIVGADRLRLEGANAFLKTLEEPPPDSVIILLSTEPHRLLETIISRCLRLNFGSAGATPLAPEQRDWLEAFAELASQGEKSLIGRYRLLDTLVERLTSLRTKIEEQLSAKSPLQKFEDADKRTIERWEAELAAAVEAEYRRHRSELLNVLHWWLRDIWVQTVARSPEDSKYLLRFPELPGSKRIAERLSQGQATENLQVIETLQRWLHTNVQEALALEVGLLKLRF